MTAKNTFLFDPSHTLCDRARQFMEHKAEIYILEREKKMMPVAVSHLHKKLCYKTCRCGKLHMQLEAMRFNFCNRPKHVLNVIFAFLS